MNSEVDKVTHAKVMAVKYVAENLLFDGFVCGIGTGTTVNLLIKAISETLETEAIELIFVPSSLETQIQLVRAGLPVSTLLEYPELDLYIDSADSVTTDFTLIKGGGGAMTREKILASVAEDFIVIVDERKYPKDLLSCPVPIEFLPEAINTLYKPITELGGELSIRYAKNKIGPVISDNGNAIGDITFTKEYIPHEMEKSLNAIPGIIENGIFSNYATKLIVGNFDGSVEKIRIK